MKKSQQILATIISLIILTFFIGTSWAGVCVGDYTIDEIDTSGDIASLSGCTEVTGSLTVFGTSLTNLNGLESLTTVGGDLNIRANDSLTSLTALSNITSVGAFIRIWGNPLLTSISFLSNITNVRHLYLISNPALESLNGLHNITNVDVKMWIGSNDMISSLNPLSNLTSVGGDLEITENHALTNLNGLDSLTTVGGNLEIRANDSLTSLTALSNITSVGGKIFIGGNPLLTSISFLSNITNVTLDLNINNNPALESLNGLHNITNVGGKIYINNNDMISSLSPLSNLTSVGGLYISLNDALTSISALSNLTGSVSGGVTIIDNIALTSLSGLENITSVGGYLRIISNATLTSLSGLENITSVGGYLVIIANANLASLNGLEGLTSVGENLTIESNNVLTNLCNLYNLSNLEILYIYANAMLSMDTANALDTQIRNNGFTGTSYIFNNNGTGLVTCDDTDNDGISDYVDNCPSALNPDQADCDSDGIGDVCDPDFVDFDGDGIDDACDSCPYDASNDIDGDGVCGYVDNCPDYANPGQDDSDSDGIGDVCDSDTVYGTISGNIQEGVIVNIYRLTCGKYVLEDTTTTDSAGYYAFSDLYHRLHRVIPENIDYSFSPESVDVQILQTVITSHDFTATPIRFDNGDGTVTDPFTGLVWLKDANCFGSIMQNWGVQDDIAAELNSGECGLSDGSMEGDWRAPNIEELIVLGGGDLDVFVTTEDGQLTYVGLEAIHSCDDSGDNDCIFGVYNFTPPGAPFINVENAYLPHNENGWFDTLIEYGYHGYIFYMTSRNIEMTIFQTGHVWPVREAN